MAEGRSTIVIWAVVAVLATLAFMRFTGGDDGGEAAPVRIEAPGAAGGTRGADGARGAGAARGERIYVHIAGAVRRPGLIRVAPGTRVAVALGRAGGPTRRADLTTVNLAAELQDGQQIVVPVAGAAPASGAAGPGAATGSKLHLSTATIETLDEIDGIGPTLAERIVEYRDTHGGFRSIDELAEVDGIGEKRLAALREAVQL